MASVSVTAGGSITQVPKATSPCQQAAFVIRLGAASANRPNGAHDSRSFPRLLRWQELVSFSAVILAGVRPRRSGHRETQKRPSRRLVQFSWIGIMRCHELPSATEVQNPMDPGSQATREGRRPHEAMSKANDDTLLLSCGLFLPRPPQGSRPLPP